MLGEAAGSLAFPLGAVRLGAVLDDPQPTIRREFFHRVDIGRTPVQVHRQDSDGAAGDLSRGIFRIDHISVIDITEDRFGPDVDHRLDAWKCGERWHQHFVAAVQSLGNMQQMHRCRPGRGKHDVLHAKISRQLLLKRLAFRPEDVIAAMDDVENAAVDFFALINAREWNLSSHKASLRKSSRRKYRRLRTFSIAAH